MITEIRKAGIISCSGEAIPEGTISRLATRRVLELLRPDTTVTLCLPLFLAGNEAERNFARTHPTIAVDGCEKRCAARCTEKYSGKPAVSIVVGDSTPTDRAQLGSARRLSDAGRHAVQQVAAQIAQHVDRLLGIGLERTSSRRGESSPALEKSEAREAACSCGSGIPVETLQVAGREVKLIALPLIFAQFREAGKLPDVSVEVELMEAVKIYNPIPSEEEAAYGQAIMQAYVAFCRGSK
jgi:uncharacterized metal-binding protein